ncbi:MAG: hypothetical protein LBQ57_13460 [Spirochaetales bacterium]|jgi:hypothetical protein|nr:hypothetical protein [Spirochaetales bacterium]
MSFEFGNDPAKIEGYKKFWRRDRVKRPLVGFSLKSWFPLDEFTASASWKKDEALRPEMIIPEEFLDDQEKLLKEGDVMDDDILRGASASQAVFWADGVLGCSMRVLPGNIAAESRNLSWEEIDKIGFDRGSPWYKKYLEFTSALVERSKGRYPVSPSCLNGPLDYVVSLRGHEQTAVDLMLDPEPAASLLERMGSFFIAFAKETWQRIPLFYGGWYDAQYNIWAPETIVRLQEDAIAVLSPDLYKKYVRPVDERISADFGSAFIHLHATSMIVLDQMLEIPTLRCFQINNDVGGPPVSWLIPYLRQVQKADKPLVIRGSFTPDELRLLVDSLEPAGLYLYIMVGDMKETEALRPIVGM